MEGAARAICGMLNADGGVVVVGVGVDGVVEGIESEDVIESGRHTRLIMDGIRSSLGCAAARRARVEYGRYHGRRLCFVYVARGAAPSFVAEDGGARFCARTAADGVALSEDEAARYIAARSKRAYFPVDARLFARFWHSYGTLFPTPKREAHISALRYNNPISLSMA